MRALAGLTKLKDLNVVGCVSPAIPQFAQAMELERVFLTGIVAGLLTPTSGAGGFLKHVMNVRKRGAKECVCFALFLALFGRHRVVVFLLVLGCLNPSSAIGGLARAIYYATLLEATRSLEPALSLTSAPFTGLPSQKTRSGGNL